MNVVPFGLIGCGDIAQKRVAPALRDSEYCELVAVNRARANLAEAFAKQFGAIRWYANWEELLRDDEVKAVTSPLVALHAEQTIAAESGNMCCEKPMALNADEVRSDDCSRQQREVELPIVISIQWYSASKRSFDQAKSESQLWPR